MEKLNIYLSSLAVLNVKLHNLHWNVLGPDFVAVHKFTEELYEEVFESYDAVAERLKMREEFPLTTLKDYLENSIIVELPSKHFAIHEVLEILAEDLHKMLILAKEVRELADKEADTSTVMLFDDYIQGYEKNLWFIRSMKS